jgi:hypothetical protein
MLKPIGPCSTPSKPLSPTSYLLEGFYLINTFMNNILDIPRKLYFHCALMSRYKEVVVDQIKMFSQKDIFNHIEVHFCVVGNISLFPKSFIRTKKYHIHHLGDNFDEYEFPTLKLLYRDAIDSSDEYHIGYIHSKGVSKTNDDDQKRGDNWRRSMMNVCVENWKSCVFLLSLCDACGWRWHPDIGEMGRFGVDVRDTHGFFYGNYWWTTASYIRTLKPIYQINQKNRYEAQMWIAKTNKKNIRYCCLRDNKVYSYSK